MRKPLLSNITTILPTNDKEIQMESASLSCPSHNLGSLLNPPAHQIVKVLDHTLDGFNSLRLQNRLSSHHEHSLGSGLREVRHDPDLVRSPPDLQLKPN